MQRLLLELKGTGGQEMGDTFILPLILDCFVDVEILVLNILIDFKMDHKV